MKNNVFKSFGDKSMSIRHAKNSHNNDKPEKIFSFNLEKKCFLSHLKCMVLHFGVGY